MTTRSWSLRAARRRSTWVAAVAGSTALATAVALVPVDAVTTARSTIFDNLLGTTAAPTSTRLGVYELSAAPTPPARFFADDVIGTLRFSTLDSGTEPIMVGTGESLTYTITLPTGLGVGTLPADESSGGWDTHWAMASATADETVVTRTQTATTPHIETVSPETHELALTADDTVQHLSEVQVDYDHPRVTSDSGTATTPVPAVSDTDWGIWNAAARPDAGDWFSPGTTGTVSFSTLDVRDPDVTATLTYDTGDTRTYTLEVPLGLEHSATDLPDAPGWTSSVTSAPRPGGGTTVTITQTAERDFDEVEFGPDTAVIAVTATPDLAADSEYSVSYAPAEQHRSTHPRQVGRVLATTEVPVGAYELRSTDPTWGRSARDGTELQFETLPADAAAVEFDLRPGDEVVYEITVARKPEIWVISMPTSPVSTPHFTGTASVDRYGRKIRVALTATKAADDGLYPSEVISFPVSSAPTHTGGTAEFTTRLPDAYRTPAESQTHALPSYVSPPIEKWEPVSTNPAAFAPTPQHDGTGLLRGYELAYGNWDSLSWEAGQSFLVRVSVPSGLVPVPGMMKPRSDWRIEETTTEEDGRTVTTYDVIATRDLPAGAGVNSFTQFVNDGLHGSMHGEAVIVIVEGRGALPDRELVMPITGHVETDLGIWDASLTAGGGGNVFTPGTTSYGTVVVTTLPSDVPKEELPARLAKATTYNARIRIPNPAGTAGFGRGRILPAFTDPGSGWRFNFDPAEATADFIEIPIRMAAPVGSEEVPRVTIRMPDIVLWRGLPAAADVPGTYGGTPTSGYGYRSMSGLVPRDFVDATDPGGRSHLSPQYVIAPAP